MPRYKDLNAILTKRKAEVQDILLKLQYQGLPITSANVRRFRIIQRPADSPTLSQLLLNYRDRNLKVLRNNYTRKFKPVSDRLVKFGDPLALDFSLDSLNDYINELIDDGKENNTIHDHVRKIRLVMRIAQSQGVKVHPDFVQFRFKYITPKPVWLTETELSLLEQFKPLAEHQVYLDECLFRCYTGLRFSDVQQLRPHHFIKRGKDVYLDFSVIKTRLDQNILLSSKAAAIARRWGFTAPKLYQQDCNERIKQIARAAKLTDTIEKVRYRGNERLVDLLPKHKMITTHVARRTFGRMWMERGGDIFKLSKYYGHSSIEQTSAYIGWTTEEVNEELKRLMG
jgi:site-specific recombinase XerD